MPLTALLSTIVIINAYPIQCLQAVALCVSWLDGVKTGLFLWLVNLCVWIFCFKLCLCIRV